MNFTGIRHVHLLVAEHDRAVAFYTQAFGMAEVFRTGPLVLVGTPAAATHWPWTWPGPWTTAPGPGSRAGSSTSACT